MVFKLTSLQFFFIAFLSNIQHILKLSPISISICNHSHFKFLHFTTIF